MRAVTDTLAPEGIPVQQPALPTVAAGVPTPRQWELDALRLVAIAGVVAIHVVGMLVSNQDLQGTGRWWVASIIDLGLTWVVPVFVMISGALVLAPRAHAAGPLAFYRKRFVRIIPALVVWHLVYLFVVRIWLRGEHLGARAVVLDLINTDIYTALYFLWLILGLYAIAPVLAAFLAGGGRRRALIMAGVALAWTHATYLLGAIAGVLGDPHPLPLNALDEWWPYVGLFLAGRALHRVVLSRRGMVIAALLGTASIAEVIWQFGRSPEVTETLDRIVRVNRLGVVVAVAAICLFVLAVGIGGRFTPRHRAARVLRRLSDASFGVFLVHLLILAVIREALPAVEAATSLWVLLAAYVVVLVASFAVSMGAARLRYVRAVF